MMRLLAASLVVSLAALASAAGPQVSIENLPLRQWGGSAIRPTLHVTGAGEEESLHVSLALVLGDRPIKGEVAGITGPATRQVLIDLPSVRARVKVTLKVQLFRGTDILAEAECPLELFPVGTDQNLLLREIPYYIDRIQHVRGDDCVMCNSYKVKQPLQLWFLHSGKVKQAVDNGGSTAHSVPDAVNVLLHLLIGVLQLCLQVVCRTVYHAQWIP